jgi:nucleoside-diphosphate-sugar epimerase
MNILITGGAGGIGSTLALLLTQNGHTVVAVDNFNNGYMENMYENGKQICDIVALDIRETKKLTELLHDNKTNVIVHLAALTSLPVCESDPAECLSVNVAGTASVLTAARLAGIQRVVVASTSAIYENNTRNYAPFEENLAVYPKLFYPLSKKLMEDVIQSHIDNYDMDIVTLRFFNVFGPRQDIHRKSPPLINYIAREVINDRKLTFYSDGYQVRDYVHVSDVVSLVEKCMTMPEAKNEIFNLCSGTLTSVRDIIEYAKLAFNKNLDYKFTPANTFWSGYDNIYDGRYPLKEEVIQREVNKFSLGSCRKTSSILGWNPNKDISSLMIDTFRNIKI